MDRTINLCVIGGGAAGMMAAGVAISHGARVTVFENTDRLGKKLAITGKGRCNVTNLSDLNELMQNVPRNSRFLYSAFSAFTPYDTMALFEELGVELKVERGNRVFPTSDRAKDVVDALRKYCSAATVIHEKVKTLRKNDDGRFTVNNNDGYTYDRVIVATGGKSYPLTGSDGSGYRLATRLGHSVTELKPSLIPLTSLSRFCADMQGLSLKNVAISIEDSDGKVVYTDFGEMMFTHFGVTGPMILSASAHLRDRDISDLTLYIDLKPALDEKQLDARLLSDFAEMKNRDFINSLGGLLPSKMIEPFVEYCGVDPRKKVNVLTKEERRAILTSLKRFEIPLDGFRPIEEAIITSGGIDVREISPKTMESKLVDGLFFAGEIIDVDAYTGGFNLQIAFSTAFLAGKNAAEY